MKIHSLSLIERVQQARLQPEAMVAKDQRPQQIAFYDRTLGHLDALRNCQQLTPTGLERLFPDFPVASAPNFLDNESAQSARTAVAAAFGEARRERTRAANSPNQEVEGLMHSVHLPDHTIRYRPDEPRWVEVDRGETRLRWRQDQVSRGQERFTLAGSEPVLQTPDQTVRARPEGSSVLDGQHLGPGYASPEGLESPQLESPWWRVPSGEWERGQTPPLAPHVLPPLSAEQLFAPLAEVQAEMAEDRGRVGQLDLSTRFHQRAEAVFSELGTTSPGDGDFMKIFKPEGYAYGKNFGSLDQVLKELKLPPADAERVKASGKKLAGFLPDGYLLSSLYESIRRVGASKTITIVDKMAQFAVEAKAGGRSPQMIADFLNALFTDVARPTEVYQQSSPTCGAASIQVYLAGQDPVKYVDMMCSLASGKNYKAGGITFKPPPGEWKTLQPDGRNLTTWMFQESVNQERKDPKGVGMPDRDSKRLIGGSSVNGTIRFISLTKETE